MQTKANLDLYNLVEALSGVNAFTAQEQIQLLAFVNRRLYEAYNRTDMWPRYLITSEPRTVANQIIPFTQDGRHVFGAGTTAVNGLYKLNGTQASAAAYSHYDTDGTTELYSLIYVSGTTWHIIAGDPSSGGAVQYINTDTSNTSDAASPTIAETGWTVSSGTAPAPSVRDLAEITAYMRIHRDQAFLTNSSVEFDFYTQSDGAHIINQSDTTNSIVYVTYKKALTYITDFLSTTASSVSEVPLEFFYFIGHAVYADFLRMDGQTEKAIIEEQLADKHLSDELERMEQLMNNNTINLRYQTHVSQQSR